MKHYSQSVSQIVDKLEPLSDSGIRLILIGGCSRSGKSTFAKGLVLEINSRKHSALALSMDSWIIGVDKRPEKSSVYERYDGLQIIQDIDAILKGQPVSIPRYDAKSRKRVAGGEQVVQISSGYLILEGVIALAYDKLCQLSVLTIFIEIEDHIRKQRFESFYSEVKGLEPEEVSRIFHERENEEVLAINRTRDFADLLYTKGQIIDLKVAK